MADLMEQNRLIARGKELNGIIGELQAELQRLQDAETKRWEGNSATLQALRENPCEVTAKAYLEQLDWAANTDAYAAIDNVANRVMSAGQELKSVQEAFLRMHGIDLP